MGISIQFSYKCGIYQKNISKKLDIIKQFSNGRGYKSIYITIVNLINAAVNAIVKKTFLPR